MSKRCSGAAVWARCTSPSTSGCKRRVALKVVVPELAADAVFRERFIRESQLAALLEHPNVIPIYDADEEDGVLYLSMRYVEGTDLVSLLTEKGGLAPQRTLAIAEQVAAALDAAHVAGLVHRDVKPANILIAQPSHHVDLSDFGLAKHREATGLTQTGTFMGSPGYCAPEQIDGRAVDGRVDVYALGCVLHHCLAGQPPFPRDSELAIIKAHLVDPPPPLSTVRPDLPRALDDVVATALAKHPDDRYPTAGALTGAVRSALRRAGPRRRDTGFAVLTQSTAAAWSRWEATFRRVVRSFEPHSP